MSYSARRLVPPTHNVSEYYMSGKLPTTSKDNSWVCLHLHVLEAFVPPNKIYYLHVQLNVFLFFSL